MKASGRLPLVGRDREIAFLSQALDQLPSRGTAVVIRGEPGLGKSRIVEEALERAEGSGYVTVIGSSSELEKHRPFAAVIDALRGLDAEPDTRELLALLIGASGGDAVSRIDLSYRAVEACLDHLDTRLIQRPLVLVLEDLHWADSSTLSFVRHVATRLMDRPLLFIGTRRPWPHEPQLDRIEELSTVTPMALSPLTEEVVLSLARLTLGSRPTGALAERLRAAGGNPLFLREVLRSGTEGDALDDFAHAITRRLTYLSAASTELLRMASILGPRFRFRALAIATGRSARDLTRGVEEALQSGLLREDGDRLRFAHDLVRDAIYQAVPAAVRHGLHLEVAGKLVEAGASPLEVAPHFLLAAEPGDATAVEWIWRAARQSSPRSPAAAVELLTRALELHKDGVEQRDLLAADLITSLLWSGDFRRAERRARELIERSTRPETRAGVRYTLARVLAYRGRVAESLAHVDAALSEGELTDDLRARLLADASLRSLVVGDVERSNAAAIEAVELAERLEETSPLALALCARSRVEDHRGHVEEAIALARRSASVARDRPSEALQFVQPALYLGLVLISGDRPDEATAVLEQGRREAESVGATWSLSLFHLAGALSRFHTGAWDDGLAEAKVALVLADETGTRVWVPWTRALIARINLHRDELDEATEQIAAARQQQEEAGCPQFGQYWIAWSEALLHEARGDAGSAVEALGTEWDRWAPDEPVGDHRETAADMVRLALANGRRDRAEEVVGALEQAAARWTSPSSQARLSGCRGLLAGDAGLIEDAARLFESTGRFLPAARSFEDAAQLEHRTATGPGLDALRIYERLGATRDASRVEGRLQGALPTGRGRPRRPSFGWESLTETELKVVSIVAEGLTNRQIGERLFVSHRTVDTHVSHALAKLEVSTRAELAVLATRHSL